jgi:hypothetical protein
MIAEGTWPHLQSISARMFKHVDDLSRIVQSMQRITDFMTDELLFTPKLLGLLRPHFGHLQALNLTRNIGFTSVMALEVMCSCPSLTTFQGCDMDAIDIVDGRPWICLRLKFLDMGIRFEPSTALHMQPLVLVNCRGLQGLRCYVCADSQEEMDPRVQLIVGLSVA